MNCLSCGATVPPDTAHCPVCGTPVPPTPLPLSPYQGMELPPYAVEPTPYREYSAQSAAPTAPSSPATAGEQASQLAAFSPTAPQLSPQYPPATAVYAPPVAPVPLVPPVPAQRSSRLVGILCAIIVILLLSNVGLLYFALAYQPSQLHREAASIAQTAAVQASATANANSPEGLYVRYTRGKPQMNDPLNNTSTSLWVESSSINGNYACKFTDGSYHAIISDTGHYFSCYPAMSLLTDLVFQVKMTIVRGDYGGLVVRADGTVGSLYLFRLNSDGNFYFYLYKGRTTADSSLLAAGNVPSIHKGSGQSNLITIIALKSHFYLFVNKENVANVEDSTYSYGYIGLVAGDTNQTTEVAYNNAEIWELS